MRQKIQLSESQLRNLIKESVKKAIMNEISSDMIRRTAKKFQEKYGWSGTDRDKLEKDEHGNPLHPKDKKCIGDHLKNFSSAYNKAKYDEDMQNPLLRKAQEMYRKVDLEQEVSDWTDNYGCDVNRWGESEDEKGGLWKVEGWGSGTNVGGGDIEIDYVAEMNFESPDGQRGSVPRP